MAAFDPSQHRDRAWGRYQTMIGAKPEVTNFKRSTKTNVSSFFTLSASKEEIEAQKKMEAEKARTVSAKAEKLLTSVGCKKFPWERKKAVLFCCGEAILDGILRENPLSLGQLALLTEDPVAQECIGRFVMSHVFDQEHIKVLGNFLHSYLLQFKPLLSARLALKYHGHDCFEDFDLTNLDGMPDRALKAFGHELYNDLTTTPYAELGHVMLKHFTTGVIQALGRRFLQEMPPALPQSLGVAILQEMEREFEQTGEAFLQALLSLKIEPTFLQPFFQVEDEADLLDENYIEEILESIKQTLRQKGLYDALCHETIRAYARDSLFSFSARQASPLLLQGFSKQGDAIMKQTGRKALEVAREVIESSAGRMLLTKGRSLLDKLGKAKQIAIPPYSLLNGPFTPAKAFQISLYAVPLFGTLLASIFRAPALQTLAASLGQMLLNQGMIFKHRQKPPSP